MPCSRLLRRFALALLLSCFPAASASAETIELVTYYPSPGGRNLAADRLHAGRATIGDPYSLTNPADLPNGTLLVWDRIAVGLGMNAPLGPLHVVGRDNTAESVLFLPGGGTGTLRVGIGANAPASLLGLGVDTRAAATRQAITIGAAGLGAPTAEGTQSAGDKLVMWNAAATANKAAIGLNAANELWLQSSGNNATNKITFYTSNATTVPSRRLTIDSNGRVGIGMANPTTQLELPQFSAIRLGGAYVSSGVGSGGEDLAHFASNCWWNGTQWVVPNPGRRSSVLQLQNGRLVFYQGVVPGGPPTTPRLTIDGNGNVGIGASNPLEGIVHVGSAGFNTRFLLDNGIIISQKNVSGTVRNLLTHYTDNRVYLDSPDGDLVLRTGDYLWTLALDPAGNGVLRGTLTQLSDLRDKTAIAPIPDALERVCALQGVMFRWRGQESSQRLQMGFIGQEMEKVFPELVATNSEGKKSVAYANLTAALIEAVKALKAENEGLRRRVEKLESTSSGR